MLPLKFALADLKKKNQSFRSFILLVMIAAVLLEAGIVLLTYVPGYYEASNERLKEPHYIIRMHDNTYEKRYLEVMQSDSRAESVAAVDCAMMDNADYKTADGKMIVYTNFFNADEEHGFFNLEPLYETASIDPKEAIYVPLSFRQQGYQVGDEVSFEFRKNAYIYRIAGFFETTWFGSTSSNLYSFYLHQEAYEELYNQVGGGKILAARLHDSEGVADFAADFKTATGIVIDSYNRESETIDNTFPNMKTISTVLIQVMSALIILISSIILGIAFLVIWFGIANQIQDSLKQIGVKKAMGCTTGQLRLSIVIEYLLAGGIGGVAGAGLSYGLLALLGTMISGSIGVEWKLAFQPAANLAGLFLILAAISGIAFLSSGKIKKMTAVNALTAGNASHTFRHNVFPLSQGGGGDKKLQLEMAGKHVFHSPRQYITLGIILMCITFVMSFSLILYRGLVADPNGFIRLLGLEISPVTVTVAPHADYREICRKLEAMDGVDGVSLFESDSVKVDGIDVTGYISDDFDRLRTYSVFKGSFPVYDNEIVVTGIVADTLGKSIGDTVTLTRNGVPASYMICGLTQSLNNFGLQCAVTGDGIRRLNPSASFTTINVYLKDGWDYERFSTEVWKNFKNLEMIGTDGKQGNLEQITEQRIADLLTMYGVDSAQYALMENGELILSGDTSVYEIQRIEDTMTLVMTSSGLYAAMIKMLTVFLTLLSAAVTAFILHYMVKSSVIKRKREFGIYMAMGYTSSQLIMQTAFCYLPVSIPGVIAGAVIGGCFTNPLTSALTGSLGISEIGFSISALLLFLLAVCILVFVFATAYICAGQIKKVSVYELFTE